MKSLVLLHGWGTTGRIWQRQVEAFGKECTVLTPRLPRWDAGWLHEYLTGLDIRESILVGWSLGGMVLLEALARFPGLTPKAAVLVGVPAVFCRQPDHPWGQPLAAVRAMRLGLKKDPHRVITDFLVSCLAPGEAGFRPEAAAGFDFAADPAYLARGLDYLKDRDLRGLLPRFPGPVTIIQGQQDGIVPPFQGLFLRENLAEAKLHLLPAGHLPFLTQPEVFNGILRELFRTG